MAEEAEKREKGFKVEDRRRFTSETGEPRESSETAAPETRADAKVKEEPRQESSDKEVPEINFSTFVISFSTQALMHLGEIPNPLSGKVEKDVSVAKQMIDIVAMLREKTKGNLDQGENKLVEDVLFDLRMRYIEAVKRK
jgi:hypothetical protein